MHCRNTCCILKVLQASLAAEQGGTGSTVSTGGTGNTGGTNACLVTLQFVERPFVTDWDSIRYTLLRG